MALATRNRMQSPRSSPRPPNGHPHAFSNEAKKRALPRFPSRCMRPGGWRRGKDSESHMCAVSFYECMPPMKPSHNILWENRRVFGTTRDNASFGRGVRAHAWQRHLRATQNRAEMSLHRSSPPGHRWSQRAPASADAHIHDGRHGGGTHPLKPRRAPTATTSTPGTPFTCDEGGEREAN